MGPLRLHRRLHRGHSVRTCLQTEALLGLGIYVCVYRACFHHSFSADLAMEESWLVRLHVSLSYIVVVIDDIDQIYMYESYRGKYIVVVIDVRSITRLARHFGTRQVRTC